MTQIVINNKYSVFIGQDILKQLLTFYTPQSKVFIIIDKKVANYHACTLFAILRKKNIEFKYYILNSHDKLKSYKTVYWLIESILLENPDRNSTIIGFGGGVIGDISGFVASILLRGIKLIHIPTTLLAQADSSIGGKTGINSKNGKNLIGTFYDPSLVVIDINLLKTLEQKTFNAGISEIIKHSILKDSSLLSWIENNIQKILERDSNVLQHTITNSCKIKSYFISNDTNEIHNKRIFLNFGHTIAHALESTSQYSIAHGEALAIGILAALKVSSKLGFLNSNLQLFDRIKNLFQKCNLPVSMMIEGDDKYIKEILSYIKKDKKNNILVLIKDLERPFLQKNTYSELIKQILTEFC